MQKSVLLLIEDNPLLLPMYTQAFEKAGFQVFSATDGKAGVALAKEKKPDLVLLDILMPGMSGYEVIQILKGDSQMKHIKIVVLSIVSEKKDIEKAKELGVRDYLVKGEYDLDQLVQKVRSYLKEAA